MQSPVHPHSQSVNSETILKRNRPYSRSKTTYTTMNDWMQMQDKPMYDRYYSNKNPPTTQEIKFRVLSREKEDPLTARQSTEKMDYEEQYRRSYMDLSQKIAYRYPNPGSPRMRQGRIGGNWRHIKEVLGHGGSRVVFVDGLVSVYDADRFTEALQIESGARPHVTKMLGSQAPPPVDMSYRREVSSLERAGYKPWLKEETSLPHLNMRPEPQYRDPAVDRKLLLEIEGKTKGVYKLK